MSPDDELVRVLAKIARSIAERERETIERQAAAMTPDRRAAARRAARLAARRSA